MKKRRRKRTRQEVNLRKLRMKRRKNQKLLWFEKSKRMQKKETKLELKKKKIKKIFEYLKEE